MKMNKSTKIEDDPLWREAYDISEYLYRELAKFPDEEKWYARDKLHSAITNFTFGISLAIGNIDPLGGEFEWSNTRKYSEALRATYVFAGRQKMIELDPGMVVRLDKMRAQIDARMADVFEKSEKSREEKVKKELGSLLEKYEIWKKMGSEDGQ
jgi:hypothetical protein